MTRLIFICCLILCAEIRSAAAQEVQRQDDPSRPGYFLNGKELANYRGSAEEAESKGQYARALALYQTLAVDCDRREGDCFIHWIHVVRVAQLAGDVSAARAAQSRAQLASARDAKPAVKQPTLDDMLIDASIMRPGSRPPFNLSTARDRILAAIAKPGSKQLVDLYRALIMIEFAMGNRVAAMAAFNRAVVLHREQEARDLKDEDPLQSFSFLLSDHDDLLRGMETWGEWEAARVERVLLIRNTHTLFELIERAYPPERTDTRPDLEYHKKRWVTNTYSDIERRTRALADNLAVQSRHAEASEHYRASFPLWDLALAPNDPDRVERLYRMARNYAAYPKGRAAARTVYRRAVQAIDVRQGYLVKADAAAAAERREVRPVYLGLVRNNWMLATRSRR